jgi:XTP/dITP diphosphohydrolase
MLKKIVFATNNAHKVREINEILRSLTPNSRGGGHLDGFEIVTMNTIGHTTDLPETHETILENAIEKAEYLFEYYKVDCFSEDTGLEIDALEGKPGVHTAHYSGSRDPQSNIDLVLKQMGNTSNRSARFRTVICLILNGEKYIFEGVCEGKIALKPSGTEGFGYDPIFKPQDYDRTFAEMDGTIKSQISHRALATQKLIGFLEDLNI